MTILMVCPHCKSDIAEKIRELPRPPVTDDYLLCYRCCQLSQFDKDLVLHKAKEDELCNDAKQLRDVFTHLLRDAKFIFAPSNQIH